MVTVIVVAAGTGSRFGSAVPKQFCQIEGRPTVMRAIDSLRAGLPEARILLVISAAETERWKYLCNLHDFDSPELIEGGATRWESVRNAVMTVHGGHDDLILVHDGARPFPDKMMLDVLVGAFGSHEVQGAVPVVPVTDSLRQIVGDGPQSVAVDRSRLRAVQTPQAFRADLLARAYELPYCDTFTDDASVMEAAGFDHVVMTPGNPLNIKITNPLDIAIAETLLNSAGL